MKRKIKLVSIAIVFMFFMIFGMTVSNAAVVSNDPNCNSGESVSITLTSNAGTESFKITLVDTGGLTFSSVKIATPFTGTPNGTTVNGISTTASKTLATYVFSVPNVENDTTYKVKFSIENLTSEENQVNTSNVTVKGSTPTPTPAPTPTPTPTPTPSNKSSDTSLSSLSIAPFGKINKASTGIYDITVENNLEKVTITATPNDSNAKVISGNGDANLVEGTNNLKVVVKAEDGTEGTHKIRIIRKTAETVDTLTPPNVIDESKNEIKENIEEESVEEELHLANLVITGVELSPMFSSEIYQYTTTLTEDIDSLEIIATSNQTDATVEIVGNTNLKIGENLITIILKSADGEKTVTYQITVNKDEPEVAAVVSDENNEVNSQQELKNKIGKIILIAAAAVILVILIGIIAITNTAKKASQFEDIKIKKDEDDEIKDEKFKRNDFKASVNEEDSYKELEKLANIHNAKKEFLTEEDFINEPSKINEESNVEISQEQNSEINTDLVEENNIESVDDTFFENSSTNNVDGGDENANLESPHIEKIEDLFEKSEPQIEKPEYLNLFGNSKTENVEPNIISKNNDYKNEEQIVEKEETVDDQFNVVSKKHKSRGKKLRGKRFK